MLALGRWTFRSGTAVCVAAFAVVAMTCGAPTALGHDLLINRGAESGSTAPWSTSGFAVGTYGSSSSFPTTEFADAAGAFGHEPEAPYGEPVVGLEAELFVGSYPGASMTQVVSLEPFAARIEAGEEPFALGGWFGGSASSDATVSARLQFLDATERAVGSAVTIGPTAADREGASTMLRCLTQGFTAPKGSRWAEVTLTDEGSTGLGLADSIYFSNVQVGDAAYLASGHPGGWHDEIKTDHCVALKPGPETRATPVVEEQHRGASDPSPTRPAGAAIITGTVSEGGAPRSGWRVLLGGLRASLRRHPMRTVRSGRGGRFRFSVAPGWFRVAVWKPDGRRCASVAVRARVGKAARVRLSCS